MDQCSSCGGFCKKSGCERQNVPKQSDEIAHLKGQIGVMRKLLMQCLDPLETMECDDAASCEGVMELINQIKNVCRGLPQYADHHGPDWTQRDGEYLA